MKRFRGHGGDLCNFYASQALWSQKIRLRSHALIYEQEQLKMQGTTKEGRKEMRPLIKNKHKQGQRSRQNHIEEEKPAQIVMT